MNDESEKLFKKCGKMHCHPKLLYYWWIGGFKINLNAQWMTLIIWWWFKGVDKSVSNIYNPWRTAVHYLETDKTKNWYREKSALLGFRWVILIFWLNPFPCMSFGIIFVINPNGVFFQGSILYKTKCIMLCLICFSWC